MLVLLFRQITQPCTHTQALCTLGRSVATAPLQPWCHRPRTQHGRSLLMEPTLICCCRLSSPHKRHEPSCIAITASRIAQDARDWARTLPAARTAAQRSWSLLKQEADLSRDRRRRRARSEICSRRPRGRRPTPLDGLLTASRAWPPV